MSAPGHSTPPSLSLEPLLRLSLPSSIYPSEWRHSGFGDLLRQAKNDTVWEQKIWPLMMEAASKYDHQRYLEQQQLLPNPFQTTKITSSEEWLGGLLTASDSRGDACIHFVASGPSAEDIESLLYSYATSVEGMMARLVRLGKRYQNLLLLLLRLKIPVDLPQSPVFFSRQEVGNTPLMVALANCWLPAVSILLQHGANPQSTNCEGGSPLTSALRGFSAWGCLGTFQGSRNMVHREDTKLSQDEITEHLKEMQADFLNVDTAIFAPLSVSLSPSSPVLQERFEKWRQEFGTELAFKALTERLRADWLTRAVCELVWYLPLPAILVSNYCLQCHVWGGKFPVHHHTPHSEGGNGRSFLELLQVESRKKRNHVFTTEDYAAVNQAQDAVTSSPPSALVWNLKQPRRRLTPAMLLHQVDRYSNDHSKALAMLPVSTIDCISSIAYPAQRSGVRAALRRCLLREAFLLAAFHGAPCATPSETTTNPMYPSGTWTKLPSDLIRGPIAAFLWG